MKNFVSNGHSKQLIAPAAGVLGGQVFGVGSIIGVVVADAVLGQQFTLKLQGEYSDCKKKAGETWAQGDKLYYDPADGALTKTAGVLMLAGYAGEIAQNADIIGTLILQK